MSTNIHTLTKAIRFSERNPKSFTKWSEDGTQSSDTQINRMIKDCVKDIQEQIIDGFNDINPSAFRVKGNTIVTCIGYRTEGKTYELTVVVARDYFSAVIEEFDPFDVPEFVTVKNSEAEVKTF
jgi:hypothetical protein